MGQLVGDSESGRKAVVLDDSAARERVADLAELRQAERVARLGHATEIFAREQDGHVVVVWVAVGVAVVHLLPAAKVAQGLRGRVVDDIPTLKMQKGEKERRASRRARQQWVSKGLAGTSKLSLPRPHP